MTKVNILYLELKYHIVDEATVYSEWLERHRTRAGNRAYSYPLSPCLRWLGRGSPHHIPVYRWNTGGPAGLTARLPTGSTAIVPWAASGDCG